MAMLELVLSSAGALIGLAGMGFVVPHRVRRAQEVRLARRCHRQRQLVLTYDDGPGTQFTPELLDLLGSADASATFFLLGQRVAGNERIVERIAAEGHEIGCHGQNHVHAWRAWPWRVASDVQQGYATLAPWVGGNAPFRPPYGKLSVPAWLTVVRRGARMAWWTVDSGDTHAALPEPETVADRVARAGGGVVLMHDFDRGGGREQFVLRTTELLLEMARREDIAICRYSDLWQPALRAALAVES